MLKRFLKYNKAFLINSDHENIQKQASTRQRITSENYSGSGVSTQHLKVWTPILLKHYLQTKSIDQPLHCCL